MTLPENPTQTELYDHWLRMLHFYFTFHPDEKNLPDAKHWPNLPNTENILTFEHEEGKHTLIAIGRPTLLWPHNFFYVVCALEKDTYSSTSDGKQKQKQPSSVPGAGIPYEHWREMREILFLWMSNDILHHKTLASNMSVYGVISIGRAVRFYRLSPDGTFGCIMWDRQGKLSQVPGGGPEDVDTLDLITNRSSISDYLYWVLNELDDSKL